MTTKHTPGPWQRHQIGDRFSGQIVGAPGLVSVCNTFERASQPEPQDKWLAEHRANARLIAAAPDLLAALRALGAYLETLPLTGDVARLVCLKDAAIAKAEDAQ